jgi:L-lactate dehydrogenase
LNSLVLIDPDKRISDGQAADICASLPMNSGTDVWAGDYADLADCMLIVLALGNHALYENAHADLISINAPLIRRAVSDIASHSTCACILVVSEPVDAMTDIAVRYAGLPKQRVFGIGTAADTFNLQKMLGKYLGTDPCRIEAMVLGQSGELATVCWSRARACGMPLSEYLPAFGRSGDMGILHSLYEDILQMNVRASRVKGCAAYTLAQAVLSVADAVIGDRNSLLTLSTDTQEYKSLLQSCMSLPCIVGRDGARVLSEIALDPTEMEQLINASVRLHAQSELYSSNEIAT